MKNFNEKRGGGRGFGGRGFGDRDSGRSQLYRATCSDCGNSCEVPFKPFPGKSVYCNDCFRKDESFESRRPGGRDFGRPGKKSFGKPSFSDRQDRRMFEATCSECGERCEVPFRPTGEKPVYCNDCFGGGNREDRSTPKKPELSNEQLNQMNAKLDRILKDLEIIKQKREFIIEKKKTEDAPLPADKQAKAAKPKKPKRKAK